MKVAAVVLALEAVASAQPPGDTVSAVDHEMAVRLTLAAHNAADRRDCHLIEKLGTRVHELDPTYYAEKFETDTEIERCRPDVKVVSPPDTPPPDVTRALTVEVGFGAAVTHRMGSPSGFALGGPTFAIGGFVSPTIAVSAHISGANALIAYVGSLGPAIQYWPTHHLWFGGGIGLGFGVGCNADAACGSETTFAANARVGAALRPLGQGSVNLSVETTYLPDTGHDRAGFLVTLLLGYQGFQPPESTNRR